MIDFMQRLVMLRSETHTLKNCTSQMMVLTTSHTHCSLYMTVRYSNIFYEGLYILDTELVLLITLISWYQECQILNQKQKAQGAVLRFEGQK